MVAAPPSDWRTRQRTSVLDRLVTGHYGLDQVEEALTAGKTDPLAVKPIVRPWS